MEQPLLPEVAGSDDVSSLVPLRRVALKDFVDQGRCGDLLRRESYLRCTQHDHKPFDFYGHFLRFGDLVDIRPDDYVPMKRRRPLVRMDLAKVIVESLTAMIFGSDHWPTVAVPGDPEAEDFARELCRASRLPVRMIEARNLGGACGTAILSWGFVQGRPLVEVHQPAHVEVLEWASWPERRPAKAIKVYPYERRVWDVEGKPRDKTYYYARYWDDTVDVTWREVPEDVAATGQWTRTPAVVVRHDAGICPVYLVQNLPNSAAVDGWSDFEGQEEGCDSIDVLLSATVTGTTSNVDPTVVIKDTRSNNEGVVRKGTGHAIYAPGGANYLELSGSAVGAARELLRDLRQYELDKAGVVILDAEKMSGAGISAAAMRTRYARMLAKCDLLLEQYGPVVTAIIGDMLTVARRLRTVRVGPDGVRYWSKVDLPPRIEETEEGTVAVERTPGVSSNVTLSWPPYFPATWQDRKEAAATAKDASGGQQVISRKTAVQAVAGLFGVEDVAREIEAIEEDQEESSRRARDILDAGAPRLGLQGENDEDQPDEDEPPPAGTSDDEE